MSRSFLIASMPFTGHVNPLKPIARALVARGHAVHWYTGARYRAAVESTGATFAPMAAELDHPSEDLNEALPGRVGRTGLDALRFDMKHAFLDPVPAQIAELRRLHSTLDFDVVVAEQGFVGAAPFHQLTQVPWVSVGITALTLPSRDTAPFGLGIAPSASFLGRLRNKALYGLIDNVLMRDVRKYGNQVWASVGLGALPGAFLAQISPTLHLQNGVPEFEYPRSDLPAQVRFVGALADRSGPAPLPAWWSEVENSAVPVIHVTQGTVADTDLSSLVLPTIRALSPFEALVVAGTGKAPVESLGSLPANVRVAPYIPHDRLLPLTTVMVTNGGYGGVQAALAAGVPLVVNGRTEEKPEVCAHVAWAGVGVNLRTASPTPAQIAAAVRTVLDDPSYRRRAAELREAYQLKEPGEVSATLIEDTL